MEDLLLNRFDPIVRRRFQKSAGFTIDGVTFALEDLTPEQWQAWDDWTNARTNAAVARFLEVVRVSGDANTVQEAATLIDDLEAADAEEVDELRERGETLLKRLGGQAAEAGQRIFVRIVSDYIEKKTGIPR
jgi:hypothetical protein